MRVHIKNSSLLIGLRWLERSLILLGMGLVCYCAISLLEGFHFQRSEAKTLDSHSLALHWTPLDPPLPPGAWRLEVDRLGISVMVVEGVGHKELAHAAGHIPGTASPGEAGNIAVSAHRDTYFRPLRNIKRNDLIRITTNQAEFRYQVLTTRLVEPTDVSVLKSGASEMLTLVTCYPFYFLGPAPKRFIVQAKRLM